MIRIVIEADMNTGHVKVTGPIDEPRIFHWMLGEALRVCERACNEQDTAATKNGGPKLTVVGALPPGLTPP